VSAHLSDTIASQVDTYCRLGYPQLADLDEEGFRKRAAPLVAQASALPTDPSTASAGQLRVLLVVTRSLISDEARVPLLRLAESDRQGVLDRNHSSDARQGLAHYLPRPELAVPDAPLYLLVGVERGDEYRDIAPRDALPAIAQRGRTPLTIDEGISLATVAPELLAKNHCFMLAGSTRGDKRVPALWISERAPKLGWCFDAVPHSWLGVASASSRVGAAT
jgi:hypothetical protein